MDEKFTEEKMKEQINNVLEELRTQAMLLGCQSFCKVVLDIINKWEAEPSTKTMNDYKRIVKRIREFCITGLKNKVETPKFDTVQN